MKARTCLIFSLTLLAAAGLKAEFRVDSMVAEARSDRKNAPAIVANAALDNPKLLRRIVQAPIKALPDEAPAILEELLKVLPKQSSVILRAAILAQPKLARELAAVAVDTLPDQAAELLKVAVDASPDDLKDAVASVRTQKDDLGGNGRDRSEFETPTFPVQPIRPPVSPSS